MNLAAKNQEPGPELPVVLSAEEWRALSEEARQRYVEQSIAALEEQADLMAESRPHTRAKSTALDRLGRHFQSIGRHIYLGSELPVLYPGDRMFAPDLMAVLDVEDTRDEDLRTAWVVESEGRGLDLALEVYFSGNWQKDFVDNVEKYARLGIPEYFLYDRQHQELHGYRLPGKNAVRYQKMKSRFGRLSSHVLGLDLALYEGRLRFYYGDAEVPDSDELLLRAQGMVDEVQHQRVEAQERAQKEAERAQKEAERAQDMLAQLRATVSGILTIRGIPLDQATSARLALCADGAVLKRWALRAVTTDTAAEAVSESGPDEPS